MRITSKGPIRQTLGTGRIIKVGLPIYIHPTDLCGLGRERRGQSESLHCTSLEAAKENRQTLAMNYLERILLLKEYIPSFGGTLRLQSSRNYSNED